jgi:hypothetical protein
VPGIINQVEGHSERPVSMGRPARAKGRCTTTPGTVAGI